MNTITVKLARTQAQIVSSGYSDRYPMSYDITVYVEIDSDDCSREIKLNAFSWDNAAEQLDKLAEVLGCATTASEFRKQISEKYELLLPYRDGCKSSFVKTNKSLISDAIAYYSDNRGKYTEEGLTRIKASVEKISREELLGIKQQMDKLNALINAGLEQGQIVEFNWQDNI
jgi:hypothetical protein